MNSICNPWNLQKRLHIPSKTALNHLLVSDTFQDLAHDAKHASTISSRHPPLNPARKMNGKDAALARTTLHGDVTMMGRNDMFDNGKS